MRLRDRIGAAVRAFCGDEALRTRLTVSEYERRLAEQELELRERECEGLRGELQEKESRLQFLYARTDALSSALTLEEFSHKFSTTEEMKRLYNAVSRSLDPDCFLLHRMAEQLAGVETVGLFPYEDARGVFEYASGRELLKYLTACCFGAVEWEIVPGTTYEKAVLREVDTSTLKYQEFERQLYESVLDRMGFGELLAPKQAGSAVKFTPTFTAHTL